MASLLSLLLSLQLLSLTELRSTYTPDYMSSSTAFNFTLPEYWSCCLHQRVPGTDPLAGLYRLYFGPPPQLLAECR